MVQSIASIGLRITNSHKLDLSSKWPILGLRLGNLIGGFRLQFHIVENSLNADDILLNIASGPHNPVLRNESRKLAT
jgi:hypothetical protein